MAAAKRGNGSWPERRRSATRFLAFSPSSGRADVVAFAGKVSLHLDPEIDRRFPAESLARVVVVAGVQRFESPLTLPRGEAFDPPRWRELEQKFARTSVRSLDRATQQRVIDALEQMKNGQIEPLNSALAQAASQRRPPFPPPPARLD